MTVEPCIDNTGCGIDVSTTPAGHLSLAAVVAALPCQALSCGPNGLFVREDEALIQAGVLPDGGGGWGPVDVSDFPSNIPVPVVLSDTETFTNASACSIENVIRVMTQRGVLYSGPAGAHFRVSVQHNLNGTGFIPIFVGQFDYRFTSTAPGGIVDDLRAGGSHVSSGLIAPGGSFTYAYQIVLTNLGPSAPGSGFNVQSPGLTWCMFSVTN